jgi:MoaA/NifB/PqqE/SkfB family radical SAM enzyme
LNEIDRPQLSLSPYSSPRDVQAEFARLGLPERFCHVPFSTLILEPDGTVGSCRMKGSQYIVGDLKTHTLEEIWNGPILSEWRRQFLAGEPVICKSEVRSNGCHLCPDYNALLSHVTPAIQQTETPLRLAVNINGRCNLQCKMCHIWKLPNGLYDEWGLWPKIESLVGRVREIELFSGEPFIQSDTYRLIDLVSEKNPDCAWTFTTNGHWVLNDKIISALDKIRIKHVTVSLDSVVPETYARIRKGGRLDFVLKNLDRLIAYDRSRRERGLTGLSLRLSFCVQRDNWRELASFHEFGMKMKLPVFRAFVHEPEECSLLTLPDHEKESIIEWYAENLTPEQLIHSRRVLVPLLDSLPKLARAACLLKFRHRSGEIGEA